MFAFNHCKLTLPKETIAHSNNLSCSFLPLQHKVGQTAACSSHYTLVSIEQEKVLKTILEIETIQILRDFMSEFCTIHCLHCTKSRRLPCSSWNTWNTQRVFSDFLQTASTKRRKVFFWSLANTSKTSRASVHFSSPADGQFHSTVALLKVTFRQLMLTHNLTCVCSAKPACWRFPWQQHWSRKQAAC